MGWAQQWEPRRRDSAARVAAGFTFAAATTQVGYATIMQWPTELSGILLSYAVPLALIGLTVLLWRAQHSAQRYIFSAVPILGVLVIAALDVLTVDASVAAQVFLLFPVLYAASELRIGAAVTTTLVAVIGEATVTLCSEPPDRALSDLVYVATAMIAMTLLLVHSAQVQERLVVRLRDLATIDALTGLATRRVLDDATTHALARRESPTHDAVDHAVAVEQALGTALVVLDVDLFKAVNDTYGHPVGDDLLIHLADILRAACRPGDVISRMGGDELAVLIADCSLQTAVRRGEQLVEAVRGRPMSLPDGELLALSISVGVGHVVHEQASDQRALYAIADAALYRAKRSGGGQARSHSAAQPAPGTGRQEEHDTDQRQPQQALDDEAQQHEHQPEHQQQHDDTDHVSTVP